MATTSIDTQVLGQLSRILAQTEEIRAKVGTTELLQVLQVLRDQVNRLSREHESIRMDLRDLRNSSGSAD